MVPESERKDEHYVMEERFTSKRNSNLISYLLYAFTGFVFLGSVGQFALGRVSEGMPLLFAFFFFAGLTQLHQIAIQIERNQRVTNELLIRMARRNKQP